MKPGKVILSGLVGTSAMTLFSYIVSNNKKRNFKEPQLLAALEKDLLPGNLKTTSLLAGWSTHYSIGIAWASAYHMLWQETKVKPTLRNGLVLGGISGLIGVLFWDAFFKTHPDPPRIDFKRFYSHLVLAHLVYGAAVTVSRRGK